MPSSRRPPAAVVRSLGRCSKRLRRVPSPGGPLSPRELLQLLSKSRANKLSNEIKRITLVFLTTQKPHANSSTFNTNALFDDAVKTCYQKQNLNGPEILTMFQLFQLRHYLSFSPFNQFIYKIVNYNLFEISEWLFEIKSEAG